MVKGWFVIIGNVGHAINNGRHHWQWMRWRWWKFEENQAIFIGATYSGASEETNKADTLKITITKKWIRWRLVIDIYPTNQTPYNIPKLFEHLNKLGISTRYFKYPKKTRHNPPNPITIKQVNNQESLYLILGGYYKQTNKKNGNMEMFVYYMDPVTTVRSVRP